MPDWKHVEYFNSAQFLKIMKEWPEFAFTQEQIEQQEKIVEHAKAAHKKCIKSTD